MVSRVLFLQGAIAWLSVCFLFMVIWHQRHPEESPAQHDAALATAMSLAKAQPHMVPPPPRAQSTQEAAPPLAASPMAATIAHVPEPAEKARQKPSYRRQPQPVAAPLAAPAAAAELASEATTTSFKLPAAKATSQKKEKKTKKKAHDAESDATDDAVDSAQVPVYMDWGRGNLAFTLANYRSLESVLAHHPKAEVPS
jgi:type IV secretory pathway VirB10-like protein